MLDDSLDKATHEQCVLLVIFINFSLMQIVTKFPGIVHIEGTPNAETIFEALNEYATTVTLPTEKMLCITTDGASVMWGSRNSVTRKALDKWNPTDFKQHCVVHKEVLGVKAALKDIPDLILLKKLFRNFLNTVESGWTNFIN